MSAEELEDKPITEKTRAILDKIERVEKKVDRLLTDRTSMQSALYRLATSAIALLFPEHEERKNQKRGNMPNNSSRLR